MKSGDKVLCIKHSNWYTNSRPTGLPTFGKVYVVASVDGDTVSLEGLVQLYPKELFAKV